MDKSSKYHDDYECFFLLNSERGLSSSKASLGKTVALVANYPACEMELPAGENYTPNQYYCEITNELYSWVYNSNGVHYIQRINSQGECEVVYHGCLDLSAEPRHEIKQWRAYLKVEKETCANKHGKYLIWVDGNGDIHQLDVEASIATNNFTTPFFQRCADRCDFIKMCVPDPCQCLIGEFVPLPESERSLSNRILDAGFKFAYKYVYYDGRQSIWSNPSSTYYINTKECFASASGFPRCIKLRIPIGNPMVIGIEVAYQKDGVWRSYELIEKYKKYTSAQQYWYERELSEIITGNNYSDEDCSFDYYFCNDKQCEKIDDAEINRVSNFIPRKPQGLIPINDALGFYNYEQGNCKIDRFEVDKFKITPIYPDDAACENEYCEVTVRAIIHNRGHNRNQFIYRLGGAEDNSADDPTDTAWFGGLNSSIGGGQEVGYDQSFKEKTRNFIVYIDGTDYWAEMKQWKSQAFFSGREYWGTLSNLDDVNTRNRWRRAIRNGEFFYQEAKIKVPKGTRGFLRLASHKATGNEQNTSTFVIDTLNSISTYKGDASYAGLSKSGNEEIYFDTCDKSALDLYEAFIIDDNAVDTGLANKASAYNGYITDNNSLPVEGAILEYDSVQYKTDHNGFYHFYVNPGENSAIDVLLKVEQDCFNFTTVDTLSIQSDRGFNTGFNHKIPNTTYTNGFYCKVNVPVKDCDGNSVSGITVSISGSKSRVTGADGVAKFKIRNYITRNRNVRVVVMNNNGCLSKACDGGCNACMPNESSATASCYMLLPTVTMSNKIINTISASDIRGLKAGGNYPFGFVIKGGCGRLSAVNGTTYIAIKKTQDKGKQGFPYFEYDATGMNLPYWAECVYIVRGENINSFELQWIIDKIERTSDGKIKLTIQSLNDYNEKYFFKTNTIYKWLKGDRIEFIKNGDGKIFLSSVNGILNYLTISPFNETQTGQTENTDADFFNQLIIEDDGRLTGLTEGAVIEIQRDKTCVNENERPYFSICAALPVDNGRLVYEKGIFNTFDTYFVNRTIGTFPSQQFEHHNPSDFWGDSLIRLSDAGRAYFVNKYESERRYGRNISLNAPEQMNFFGDFVKTFDCPEQGDITSMSIVDNDIILAIGERDNFLAQAANDLLIVGGDGIVRAKSADQVISNAQPKLIGKYGCGYDQIGSIFYGDGYALWADGNNHCYVKHNYSAAEAIDEGRMRTYFKKRIQEMQAFNRVQANPLNKLRFSTGINSQTKTVYLTIKALRDAATNNEKAPFILKNETIAYSPVSEDPKGDFLGFVSFTPEGYGRMDLFDGSGCAFVTYFNGIPYIHPIISQKWNEFYGIAVDRVVGITLNKYPDKTKNGLAIEVHDQTMWYVYNISTEKANFRSEIPPIRWARKKNHWNASFLCNINARGGLYGNHTTVAGEATSGEFIDVLFVRDNTDNLKYGTIDNSKRVAYDELSNILFKFSLDEQSGVTENL